jgi:diaminohydroxyphosphoribosylaminopyrimidine deaminase/5-amino-6-(5-phosphoribosylamino)uracil reductase
MTDKRKFEPMMHRALELALLGPAYGVNPQVGAIILDKALNIISEGWHKGAGTPHAEVDALSKLPNGVPAGATAVVTLEPCNHTGRTGPCAVAQVKIQAMNQLTEQRLLVTLVLKLSKVFLKQKQISSLLFG